MKPFEATLSLKLRAENIDAAKQQADKLAQALTTKLGPAVCTCVWSIREEEFKQEKKQ